MASIYTGKKFGQLTVVDGFCVRTSGGYFKQKFVVKCDCGTEYTTKADSVLSGKTNRCADCRRKANAKVSERGWKHPLHTVWGSMVARCYDAGSVSYENYGARGVKVCDKWLGSRPNGEMRTIDGFHAFVADMGPRPGGRYEYTIERVDNDGDYTPENCVWATYLTQQNNRRNNVIVDCQGVTRTTSQWARELGVDDSWAAIARKYGVSLGEAVQLLRANGVAATAGKWQEAFGVTRKAPAVIIRDPDDLDDLFDGIFLV